MKTMLKLKRGARLLLYPLFLGSGLSATQAQLNSFTHTYVASDGLSRVDPNNSNMIMTPYYGSDLRKSGYLMASNIEQGGALAVKLTAIHPTTGMQTWSRIYRGDAGSGYGNTRCFAITHDRNDNGYVLTGYRNNLDTKRDELWLMKIDADGNFITDFSFSADSIPCFTDGASERPCQIFYEPSFYGLDILQVAQDPDSVKNGDFVVTGFLSDKPAIEEYAVRKRSFVWRFRYSRLSGSATPGIVTRYLKVFHGTSAREAGYEPTSEDYTYDVQEIPKYGLMLLGHIPSGRFIPRPPAPPRRPYYALMNYDGGGAATLHSTVFNYANHTNNDVRHVRTLLGKDDVIYMLGYYYPTHSFTITPMKPVSGGTGITRIYYSPDARDMPAFSMFQSRNNSDELVIMGYRLGVNEGVRNDYIHPYTIKISKGGTILSKFNLEAIRSPLYNSYAPGNPGGNDFFRPFETVFPLATNPEIGLLNNHIGYNDAVVAGVLYRGFTSITQRYHATATQFKDITEDAECHPYRLGPDQDSVVLPYNPVIFTINNISFHATRYRTFMTDAFTDYGCADIPQQKEAPTGVALEQAGDKSFSLYPNPAHDQITIRFSGDNQEMQVAVLDITGRILSTETNVTLGSNQPYTLNLSKLVPGVYIIAISDGNGSAERFKIVKE
jgi:hypothetical protein